jgi:4-aminobutyrate aminotransferase-like enzyme
MLAVEVADAAQLTALQSKCLSRKMLTLSCGTKGLRFATALNVTRDILDEGLSVFDSALKEIAI